MIPKIDGFELMEYIRPLEIPVIFITANDKCATVVGSSHNSRSDHAWNMVRLNGEWYCVDVTWDANAWEQGAGGEAEEWDYFNVTSDDMADSDHQWDYANTPEATAEDRGKG